MVDEGGDKHGVTRPVSKKAQCRILGDGFCAFFPALELLSPETMRWLSRCWHLNLADPGEQCPLNPTLTPHCSGPRLGTPHLSTSTLVITLSLFLTRCRFRCPIKAKFFDNHAALISSRHSPRPIFDTYDCPRCLPETRLFLRPKLRRREKPDRLSIVSSARRATAATMTTKPTSVPTTTPTSNV